MTAPQNDMPESAPGQRAIAEPLEEARSRYRAMMSILDDIELARQQVEGEKVKLESVVQGLSDGVVLLDHAGEVAASNRRVLELLGLPDTGRLSRRELDGVAWLVADHLVARLEEGGASVDDLVTVSHEPLRVLRVQARPLLREGRSFGTLLLFSDATRQRELDLAKNELIINVSHELRTPLTAIKIALSNIDIGVFGDVPAAMTDVVRMGLRNVERLNSLIEELLEAGTISERGLQLHLEEVDVGRLCDEICTTYAPQMQAHELAFQCEGRRGEAPLVADAKRLYWVISNLINNAIKFTPAGGSIRVSVALDEGAYRFSVADTGIGIDPSEHARIFERFHQVGREFGPGIKGVGLGLNVSSEIVRAHGGRIWVESELNKGATFFFTIPTRRG